VRLVNSREEFHEALKELIGDDRPRAALADLQRSDEPRWARLDGGSAERVVALLRGARIRRKGQTHAAIRSHGRESAVPHPLFDFRKQAIDALGTISGSVKLWDVVSDGRSDEVGRAAEDRYRWRRVGDVRELSLHKLKRFRQLSCEFHWSSRMQDPEFVSLCLCAIENLRKVFFPTHLHANNFVGFCTLMGVPLPEVSIS
jgi:hypothetical protein